MGFPYMTKAYWDVIISRNCKTFFFYPVGFPMCCRSIGYTPHITEQAIVAPETSIILSVESLPPSGIKMKTEKYLILFKNYI